MTRRSALFLAVLFLASAAAGGVKIAGIEFVPKDLVFAPAESKSRASADGPLPQECKWLFNAETRIGRVEEDQGCIRFYYKTTVTMAQACPAAREQTVFRKSERITALDPRCPDKNGRIAQPATESRALSSGVTADGRQQDILVMPDKTRIVLSFNEVTAWVTVTYPDGSADSLKVP